MREQIHFVTGRLAEHSLRKLLAARGVHGLRRSRHLEKIRHGAALCARLHDRAAERVIFLDSSMLRETTTSLILADTSVSAPPAVTF